MRKWFNLEIGRVCSRDVHSFSSVESHSFELTGYGQKSIGLGPLTNDGGDVLGLPACKSQQLSGYNGQNSPFCSHHWRGILRVSFYFIVSLNLFMVVAQSAFGMTLCGFPCTVYIWSNSLQDASRRKTGLASSIHTRQTDMFATENDKTKVLCTRSQGKCQCHSSLGSYWTQACSYFCLSFSEKVCEENV